MGGLQEGPLLLFPPRAPQLGCSAPGWGADRGEGGVKRGAPSRLEGKEAL